MQPAAADLTTVEKPSGDRHNTCAPQAALAGSFTVNKTGLARPDRIHPFRRAAERMVLERSSLIGCVGRD